MTVKKNGALPLKINLDQTHFTWKQLLVHLMNKHSKYETCPKFVAFA
jgi:hypothetical protein